MNMKNLNKLNDQELSNISGGNAGTFDLEKLMKVREERMKRNGVQTFSEFATRAEDQN